MATPLVAVTDHVFRDLEPTKQVLSELHAEARPAQATTPEAILSVAREADSAIVCYAQMLAPVIDQLKSARRWRGPRDGDVAHAGSQDSFRPKQVARMFSSKEPRYPVNLKQLQAQKK